MAHQRDAKKERFVRKLLEPTLIRETRMCQAQLGVPFRVTVDQGVEPELLNKSFELTQRRGSLVQIDEMRLDPTLGEKPQGFSGVGAFLHTKDLNFHRLRRTVI
jgi:hypothetical protein